MSRRKSIYGSYVSFNPIDLTPVWWLSARGLVSNTSNSYGIVDGSGYISQMNDLSGNGHDVSQGTASAQPLLNSSVIGSNLLNSAQFLSGDRLIRATTNIKSGTSSWTVFTVGNSSPQPAISFDAFNERLMILPNYTNKTGQYDNAYRVGANAFDNSISYVTTHVLNKDVPSANYYVNNTLDPTTNAYVPREIYNTAISVGNAYNNSTFYINHFGELIVYDRALTSGEITQVNNWLNSIYGIY